MEQNDKRSAGVHVGSASIIMIFAVLCLTVFSTLSYVTADQERRLAEKSALAMQQYYAADWQCEEKYEQILALLKTGASMNEIARELDVQVKLQNDGYRINYAVDIDAYQQLEVQLLARTDGTLYTEQWCTKASGQQNYDNTIDVWDGELGE